MTGISSMDFGEMLPRITMAVTRGNQSCHYNLPLKRVYKALENHLSLPELSKLPDELGYRTLSRA